MPNAEKKQKSADSKVHLTTTISKENYDWITKYRGRASNLLETAINWLRMVTEEGEKLDNIVFGLRMSKYGRIEGFLSGPVGIRTQDLQHVRNNCKFERDIEIEGNSDDIEIFQPSGELNKSVKFPYTLDGREIRGVPGKSIGEFISGDGMEERFLKYCSDTGVAKETTSKTYYNVLVKMTNIYVPPDLVGLTLTMSEFRALPKFMNFITTDVLMDGFNGYSKEQWKGNQKRTKNNVGSRADLKTIDLTAEEVLAGRNTLTEQAHQIFYTLLGYSGSRLEHLYEFLCFDDKKKRVEEVNGVLRCDISDTAKGKKKEAYLYFPVELKKTILIYEPPYSIDTMREIIGSCGTAERPINASSLRKWQFNTLMDHMERVYANAIQGRAADGVDAAHYMDVAGKAAKWYPEALPDLQLGLPIPDWIINNNWNYPKSKKGLPNKGAAGVDRVGESRRKKVDEFLAEGKSVKWIAKELKMSTVTIRKIRDGK